jgi:hypothetical protein
MANTPASTWAKHPWIYLLLIYLLRASLILKKSTADYPGITEALEPSTTDNLPISAIHTQIKRDKKINNISPTNQAGYNIINNFFGQHNIDLEAVSNVEEPAK